MKRASSMKVGVILAAVSLTALSQPPNPALQNRPSARQLLEVPVSGNPIGRLPYPDLQTPL